jgi:beta-N-acetylhexosaminidase
MIDIAGLSLEAAEREVLAHPLVGGVILFRRNFESPEQVTQLAAEIHELRSPSLLVAVDQEGGRVQRFGEPFTALPPMRLLGHRYDEDREGALAIARSLGWLMAAELRACGIDLSFAPVVDVDHGMCDVIGDRAVHERAAVVARLTARVMQGMEAVGMAATAKHFPTHGGVVADSHLERAVDRRPLEQLDDDLEPYRRLIASGLHGVMMAHVIFPELDPLPAGFSHWWIQDQLRGALGFQGAVFSDDLSMAAAAELGDLSQRVHAALQAGCDMVLICNAPDAVPGVLADLEDFSSPPSQLRLMRLRGRGDLSWDGLHADTSWRSARASVQHLLDPPRLNLEG